MNEYPGKDIFIKSISLILVSLKHIVCGITGS